MLTLKNANVYLSLLFRWLKRFWKNAQSPGGEIPRAIVVRGKTHVGAFIFATPIDKRVSYVIY